MNQDKKRTVDVPRREEILQRIIEIIDDFKLGAELKDAQTAAKTFESLYGFSPDPFIPYYQDAFTHWTSQQEEESSSEPVEQDEFEGEREDQEYENISEPGEGGEIPEAVLAAMEEDPSLREESD